MSLRLPCPVTGAPVRPRFTDEAESIDASQVHTCKAAMDHVVHQLLADLGPLVDGSKTCDKICR